MHLSRNISDILRAQEQTEKSLIQTVNRHSWLNLYFEDEASAFFFFFLHFSSFATTGLIVAKYLHTKHETLQATVTKSNTRRFLMQHVLCSNNYMVENL